MAVVEIQATVALHLCDLADNVVNLTFFNSFASHRDGRTSEVMQVRAANLVERK